MDVAMRRILIITLLLVGVWGSAWGANLYVTQNGTGDGLTPSTPDSIADYNAGNGNFATLDGDTVYFVGPISTRIYSPDHGTAENRVTLDLSQATLSGITETYAVYPIHDYYTIRNAQSITVPDVAHLSSGIVLKGDYGWADNNTISGNGVDATFLRLTGIWVLGSGCTVTNNNVSNLATGVRIEGTAGGLGATWIGTKGNGNIISYCRGNPVTGGDGIHVDSDDDTVHDLSGLVIAYNKVTEWGDDGIDLYYGANVVCEYNEVGPSTWNSVSVDEGNGIKCGSNNAGSTGNIVRYNKVYNINHTGVNADNYAVLTNYTRDLELEYNIIDSSLNKGIYVHPGGDFEINNNTIIGIEKRAIHVLAGVTSINVYNNIFDGDEYDAFFGSGVTGGHNCLKNDTGPAGGSAYTGTGDVHADPRLTPSYRLQCNSPARRAGDATVVGATDTDLRGHLMLESGKVNMGAYAGCVPLPQPRDRGSRTRSAR